MADYEDLLTKYFRQKGEFYIDMKKNELKFTTQQLQNEVSAAEELDPQIKLRAEYMYS